jgi:transposase-like protein
VWKCRDCRKQFSVLTGTIFHGTKIPIRTWLMVTFDASTAKNGISAREIERKYGLTPRSAWHLMHRLREAMNSNPLPDCSPGASSQMRTVSPKRSSTATTSHTETGS